MEKKLLSLQCQKENLFYKEGVVLALLHGESILVQRYKKNHEKGICIEGAIGLPSETLEDDDSHEKALRRVFYEELGFSNLKDLPLRGRLDKGYYAFKFPYHNVHTYPLSAQAHIYLMHTDGNDVLKRINIGQDNNEIVDAFFMPLQHILHDVHRSDRVAMYRQNPSTLQIISSLHENKFFSILPNAECVIAI